jgi:hypothetical protein
LQTESRLPSLEKLQGSCRQSSVEQPCCPSDFTKLELYFHVMFIGKCLEEVDDPDVSHVQSLLSGRRILVFKN